MHGAAEQHRASQQPSIQPSSYEQRMFQKCSTYLAMVAFVLQDSPNHMLTFSELMHKLEALVSRDRSGLASNIRVCLSTNKCFVKIASNPENPKGKKNYWKLDHSRISVKMVRRHFKGILKRFPELTSKMREETATPLEHCTTLQSPRPVGGRDVHVKAEMKFTGPFSIDSLLRKDDASLLATKPYRLSHIPCVPVRVGQQPTQIRVETKRKFKWDSIPVDEHFLQPSNGSYHFYPTGGNADRRFSGAGIKPTRQSHMSTKSSFVISATSGIGPYFTDRHDRNVSYPTYIL